MIKKIAEILELAVAAFVTVAFAYSALLVYWFFQAYDLVAVAK